MINIKLRDKHFSHESTNSSSFGCRSKYINWDRGDVNENDICFFTGLSLNEAKTLKCKKKIAWLLEPPVYHPEHYKFVKDNHILFDYILTYSREMLSIDTKFLFYPNGMCWVPESECKVHKKLKKIVIISSNKTMTPNQKFRHAIVNELASKYAIDVYGNCKSKFVHPKDKWSILKDYMFSIEIENMVLDDYFTEKIMDPIALGTIPIYMGTKNIKNYFNSNSILEFTSNLELELILKEKANEEFYNSKLTEVNFNLNQINKFRLAEDWIFENYNFLFN